MALKIRLRQQGRANRATYRMVVTECASPRDGKYIELLGWYNPLESEDEKMLSVRADRIQFWLDQGAMLTEKAAALVSRAAPKVIELLKDKERAHLAKVATKRKARKAA